LVALIQCEFAVPAKIYYHTFTQQTKHEIVKLWKRHHTGLYRFGIKIIRRYSFLFSTNQAIGLFRKGVRVSKTKRGAIPVDLLTSCTNRC